MSAFAAAVFLAWAFRAASLAGPPGGPAPVEGRIVVNQTGGTVVS